MNIRALIERELNEEQREAVLWTEGPILVFAGAGSGKTKTLTMRIAYLIEGLKINPTNILAVTFTNKAAYEMKSRVEKLLNRNIDYMWIGTFHSMCVRILRREIHHLGYKSNFSILDEEDSVKLISDAIKSLEIPKDYFSPKKIYREISWIKSRGKFVNDYIPHDNYEVNVKRIFKKYEEIKKEGNLLDFDDLINFVTKVLNKYDEVSHFYGDKFKFILVDEYQDINPSQHKLLKALTKYHKNIFVVGDDDQSIYRFRGSTYELMLSFKRDFKGTKVVYLSKNYRSTETIVNASKGLILFNKKREEKPLKSTKKGGEKIKVYAALNEIDEAMFVVRTIDELISKGISLNDIAILYRTNSQSRAFEDILIRSGIPYRIVGGIKFYQRKEIKDIISYLRLLLNYKDFLSLERVFSFPKRGIGKKTIERIKREITSGKDMIQAIESVIKETSQTKIKENLEKFKENFKKWETLKDSVFTLVETIIKDTNFRDNLEDERRENVDEFLSIVRDFIDRSNTENLDEFLSYISLITDADKIESTEKITLMTVHAAKGLEFDTVFVVGLEEGLFPHFKSLASCEDIEEERRLMYVAMTRAKERLFLTYALRRTIRGRPEFPEPSRFLNEIPGEYVENLGEYSSQEESKSQFVRGVSVREGERIRHEEFGYGIVIEVHSEANNPYIVVDFGEGNIKQLSLKYAPIRKE